MKKPRIVVQGSLLFDFFVKAKQLPKPGQTIIGNSFGMFSGGKGANQAVQLARLGADVTMIGRVGCDFMGDFLLGKLQAEGMDISHITRDETVATGLCAVHVDESGHNDIIIVPMANTHACRADIMAAEPLIATADIVLCQLETTTEAVESLLDVAGRHGVPAVINPAPAVDVPDSLIRKAYLTTPNETEAEFFSGVRLDDHDPEAWRRLAADALQAKGWKNIIITLGDQGCYHADGLTRTHVRPFKVDAVDTTAAGDAFSAALCYALAVHKSMDAAIAYANAAGALAASRFGSQASLCTLIELESFLGKAVLMT